MNMTIKVMFSTVKIISNVQDRQTKQHKKVLLSLIRVYPPFYRIYYLTLQMYVHTLLDSFCAAMKIIPDMASVHT